jgi:hypothetical protein
LVRPRHRGGILGLQHLDDVLQIAGGTGETIDARHDKRVTLTDEFEQLGKFGAAFACRSASLHFADDVAAEFSKSLDLNGMILRSRADARISVS